MLVYVASQASLGCASRIVRAGDVPLRHADAGRESSTIVLDAAPPAMAEELRAFARERGEARETVESPIRLHDLCTAGSDLVLRTTLDRRSFHTNTGDRNALFIYESAIVVGLPVTLISAFAWPWYGETIVAGALHWADCRSRMAARPIVRSFHVRSEGVGFVRGRTIQEAQEAAALRGLTRTLLAAMMRERQGERP